MMAGKPAPIITAAVAYACQVARFFAVLAMSWLLSKSFRLCWRFFHFRTTQK
jgi:hypothetical protein